ncbi:MAG: GNAT family N-acetyltransferase [Pseudomonadota bacterium]
MTLSPPEPITAAHKFDGFDSGRPTLDDWLKKRARRNEREGGSRTYIVCDGASVVAYYALATGAVTHAVAPGGVKRNMPDPVPVMLLARLAVAQSHQGRGLARALVRDAILRTLSAAEIAGIRALLTHAIDEPAAQFYAHLGFRRSRVDPLVLMTPLSAARSVLSEP